MTELLEGPDSGHPDNAVLIERELEFEMGYEVKEAATRHLAYKMAAEAGYNQYFKLAYHLIYCTLAVTALSYYLVARNELSGESAIVVGSLITMWRPLFPLL